MDRLSPFFTRFSLAARVFYSGKLCGVSSDHSLQNVGFLHVLRRGILHVEQGNGQVTVIDEPSVLFYPRPFRHRFRANKKTGAELVCAEIEFGAGMRNPLLMTLPEFLVVPLGAVAGLVPTIDLLFAEAFSQQPARQTAVDRLAEYLLVLLLRAAMNARLVEGGVLSGLADVRLAPALAAMHERPERAWSLEALARRAGMSRARFAARFRDVMGVTPFDYLADWRIGVAQTLLRKGEPLKTVAPAVGYTHPTALTRVFVKRIGVSPARWVSRNLTG